ncbi:MAG: ABC transporter substrate-binding protein [Rhodobacter sp.]|nr:ABC transporter substrate-binding protein [Rhodobacter sp.]
MTFIPNELARRGFLLGSAAIVAASAVPAFALTTGQAEALIDKVVSRINSVINSGKSERAMYTEFERIFAEYADVNYISVRTLGPPARAASKAQLGAYARAFQRYIARKYGKRFREFIGGQVIVREARSVKSFFEVKTTTVLKGMAPFNVSFFVSDKSGRHVFFDMRIEGISLVNSEKAEISAMLDKRGGNLDRLIADLDKLG